VLDKFYANNTCNPRSKLRYSIENYCRSLLEWYFAALQGNAASQVTTAGSYKNILFVNLHRGRGAGLVCSYDAQAARTLLRLIRDDHRKAGRSAFGNSRRRRGDCCRLLRREPPPHLLAGPHTCGATTRWWSKSTVPGAPPSAAACAVSRNARLTRQRRSLAAAVPPMWILCAMAGGARYRNIVPPTNPFRQCGEAFLRYVGEHAP
jgi:hypothetical protein